MSALSEAMKPYLSPPFNLVALKPGEKGRTCDNHLLFTSEYLLMRTKEYSDCTGQLNERIQFRDVVAFCEVEPGLYGRYPKHTDFNSHDDLTGLACFSSFLAKDILKHGRANRYCWDTESPGKWSWRGFLVRIPGFWTTIKVKACQPINIVDKVWFCVGLLGDLFSGYHITSGKRLNALKVDAVAGHSTIIDYFIRLWRWRMNKQYPKGKKELNTIYFGAEHPLSAFAPEKF